MPRRVQGSNNPFRQVIVNTHAPGVVDLVRADDLLIARPGNSPNGPPVSFASIVGTWRARAQPHMVVGSGALLPYASPPQGQLQFEIPEAS